MRRTILFALASLFAASALELKLPVKPNSVRLAVIGDSGTGGKGQFEIARMMAACRGRFPFDFVLMLGDNIYGSKTADDFRRKFEEPYAALLQSGVKFYASLGNHDATKEPLYKPFNMDGKRYYNFRRGNAEFFALDSNYMDRTQLEWLTARLQDSHAAWKICYLHHPLYSHGKAHGPDLDLRKLLEPIFKKYGVNAVFAGHEHSYERLKPQNGIVYFVLGSSGQLIPHNLRPSDETAKGFDTDQSFALVEIAQNELYFQVISRGGQSVDSGAVDLNRTPAAQESISAR